jgi:hypothetical protein
LISPKHPSTSAVLSIIATDGSLDSPMDEATFAESFDTMLGLLRLSFWSSRLLKSMWHCNEPALYALPHVLTRSLDLDCDLPCLLGFDNTTSLMPPTSEQAVQAILHYEGDFVFTLPDASMQSNADLILRHDHLLSSEFLQSWPS